MKIAVWHNTGPGGARRYLYSHVKALLERGHVVESWCLSTTNQDFLPLGRIVKETVKELPPRSRPSPWPWTRLRSRWNETSATIAGVSGICPQCADEIHRGGFDVLLAANCITTSVPPIGLYVNIPKVMYLQDPRRKLYEAMPDLLWTREPYIPLCLTRPASWKAYLQDYLNLHNMRVFAQAERRHAAAYDLLLVNSVFSRENTLRDLGVDCRTCYMGIDTSCFADRHFSRENMVLGVGEFGFHKNIPFIIESVAAMSRTRPRLVWAGNGGPKSYMNELAALAKKLGVDFEPVFGVKPEDMVDYYNRAGVLIYTPRLEPFGLAPLEANACGLPVVAVAEGGPRETVRDGLNGFLVEHDPRMVAEAAERILMDRVLAKRLGEDARKWVEEKWSIQQSVERLEGWLNRARVGNGVAGESEGFFVEKRALIGGGVGSSKRVD